MTPAEFAKHVHEFAFEPSPPLAPEVAALGVLGEIGEWLEAEPGEDERNEAGDVMFYLAAMAHMHGHDFAAVVESAPRPKGDILRHAVILAEAAKKAHYGKKCVTERLLANIVAFFPADTLASVFEANRQKLKARWPRGFGK